MNDLPQNNSSSTPNQQSMPPTVMSSGGKEGEGIAIAPQELPLKGVGQEIQLPKEVLSAGVKVTPQTVPLPPQLTQAGVQSVGANVPVTVQPAHGLKLPLSDEQIAQALKESIKASVRWLAEWCVRRIKIVHAKVIRKDHH